jgi:hypothetical protein
MLYITNRDLETSEISELIEQKVNLRRIDCSEYKKSQLMTRILSSIHSKDFIQSIKHSVLIENGFVLTNEHISSIFNSSNTTDIYIIGINRQQEKYIYRNFKKKYRYYKSSYNRYDNFFLNVKKLMYLPKGEKRNELKDEIDKNKLSFFVKVLGYNLLNTDLDNKQLLYNIDLLSLIFNLSMTGRSELGLELLIETFEVPTYGEELIYIKREKSNKKKKESKPKKNKVGIRKASNVMTTYFKERNKKSGNKPKPKNKLKPKNNKKRGFL